MVTSNPNKLRVAVIGCGAVAQKYHIPILAGHDQAELVAFVDKSKERLAELSKSYGVKYTFTGIEALDKRIIDAAMIATPASSHASYSIELAKKGIHVLTEKPMAFNTKEAGEMIRAADENNTILSVNLFRRLLPSARLLKALVESEQFGQIKSFYFGWGGFYSGESFTLGNVSKKLAGGGVLMDLGPHVLDLALFVLGDSAEVLEYQDNSKGGIETDCHIRLRIFRQEQDLEGTIELGRTRKLGHEFQVECEQGKLELEMGERYKIRIKSNNSKLKDPLLYEQRIYNLSAQWEDELDSAGYEVFRDAIDDWGNAIRTKTPPQLSGHSVLPVVKITEECYKKVKQIEEPWMYEGIKRAPGGRTKKKYPRVLITGATGFIGGRTAEMLQFRGGWDIRALAHNPNHAARLSCLPAEIMRGDLTSKADVRKAVEGCDAVVHCGIGTTYERKEVFKVTVGGTKNIAEAALRAGVKRFVHISSRAVHSWRGSGILDETTPICPAKNDTYATSKAEAEKVINSIVKRGLSAAILRPTTVYGPFAPLILVGPIKRLLQGDFAIGKDAFNALSNTVYIDNTVEAIVKALTAPHKLVNGEAFLINEDDGYTQGDFYNYFARAAGIEMPVTDCDRNGGQEENTAKRKVCAGIKSCGKGFSEIMKSTELREFLKKTLNTKPIGQFPRFILNHSPWLTRCLQKEAATVYYRPQPEETGPLVLRGSFSPQISVDKAQRVLGFSPIITREKSMELTVKWLKYARLI